MALTGGYLSKKMNNDDNTHGFGNHFSMRTSIWPREGPSYRQEISNIQNCALIYAPQEMYQFKEVTMEVYLEAGLCMEIMKFLFQRMHQDFQ